MRTVFSNRAVSITVTLCDPAVVRKIFDLSGRDHHSQRQRIVAVEFVERNLDGAADVVSEQGQRVTEDPSVFHVRQGNQVLRPKLRNDNQLSIGRGRHMKHAGHIVKWLAVDHSARGGVDDRDF